MVGIAAIPFLVTWGLTGAHFELKQVSDLRYAVLPGHAGEERTVASTPLAERAITMDQAAAIARRTVPDGRLVSVSVPASTSSSRSPPARARPTRSRPASTRRRWPTL